MEGSRFDAGVEAPKDDPFAGAEEEFSQDADPLGEPPIVDREGNQVAPSAEDEQALAEADRMREEEQAALAGDTAEAKTEPATTEPQPDPLPAAPDAPSAEPGEAAGSKAPAPPETGPTGQTSEGSTAQASGKADPPPATDGAPPAASTDGEPAATEAGPPKEIKNEKGDVTHRRYLVLQPDGDGKWREVHWYEKDGRMVKKGTPGAKRQRMALARGQDDALEIGYRAVGEPEGGVALVAVAMTYFQQRHVEPDPEIPPIRQRLKIR